MADDIASLGISVDSSQATKAAGELDKLAASSKNAEKASNDLANASTISANQQRYYETIARKTGETVDQVATRYKASADALKAQAGAAGQAEAAHVTLAKSVGSTVLASTGLGMSLNASRAALSLLATPLMATVTGVVALGAGAIYASESWKDGQRDIERALVGIGARSGATVDDINKFASASATATGLSITSGRNAAIEFIKTGAIYKENVGQALSITDAFSKTMGVDAAEGAKALGKALSDPIKGAQDLDKQLGFLNARTLDSIEGLVAMGDKQGAQRVLLDAITPKIEQAAKLTNGWADAWTAVKNTASNALSAAGEFQSPGTPQGQLERIQKTGAPIGIGGAEFGGADLAAKQMEGLQKSIDAASLAAENAHFAHLSEEIKALTAGVIPALQQMNKMQAALSDLRLAENTLGGPGSLPPEMNEAKQALEVQLQLTKDQTAEEARHNAKVLEIAGNYQGVSTQTALALDLQKQQLAVASAVTGEERLSAQEALQRYQLDLQGKDGAVTAAGQRQNVEAQIASRVQAQLLAMRDQLAVAQAVTGAERMRAEAAATTSALTRDIGDASLAQSVAASQQAIAEAQISSGIQNQVSGLSQQTELIRARANGSEAAVAAAQAYTNAIKAGATETDAAALSAAVLANNVAKAAGSGRSFASSMSGGMNGGYASLNQGGNQTVGLPGTSGTPMQQAMWNAQYGPGGFSTYLSGGSGMNGSRFDVRVAPNDQGMEFAASQQLQAAALKNMDAVTAAKFKAGSFKLPAIDAQNLANSFLQQGRNATDINAQKAAASFVSQYGDSSSSSSSSGLSPLYLSSSGSTNLGFRAAEGMDYTVPGSGPVDSVKVSGMVSPGERMIMIPPGGAAPRDMQSGSSQSRPAIQQTINISAPSMQGASDTMSQLAARASRAAYAASRHR